MISRDTLSQWLKGGELSFEEKTNEKSEWQLVADYGGLKLSIRKPLEKDFLVISRAIEVSEQHKILLQKLSSKEHQIFANQLERDILFCGVQFQLRAKGDKNEKILDNAVFGRQFYGNENSRDSFFNNLFEIHRASLIFIFAFKILEAENG